jgi:hypothetical protein
MRVFVAVVVLCSMGLGASAAGGPYVRAADSGTCAGAFDSCHHTQTVSEATGRMTLDLRIVSTQAGLLPADGFAEGRATLGADRAWPAGASQAADVTVTVNVSLAEIARRNGLLAPPLWTDQTPSAITLLFHAYADGCECAPVQRVVAGEGSAPSLGAVTQTLRVTGGASVIHVDVTVIGLARLSHDLAGSHAVPDIGQMRTRADVVLQDVSVAAAA